MVVDGLSVVVVVLFVVVVGLTVVDVVDLSVVVVGLTVVVVVGLFVVVVVDLFVVVVGLSVVVVVDLFVVVVVLSVVVVVGGVDAGRGGGEGILLDNTKFFSSHSTKSHIFGTCLNSSLMTIGSTLIFMGKVRLAKLGWVRVFNSCGKKDGTFLSGFPGWEVTEKQS